MQDRKLWLWLLVGFALAICFALLRPGYFNNPQSLGAVIFLQLLIVILLSYRQTFFPVLVVVFICAGTAVPGHALWTSIRWLVLGVGAAAGLVIWLKSEHRSIRSFHLLALACVLTGLVSAMVSAYPEVALLKAGSLSLLFLYSATGVQVAVIGNEEKFFAAVLWGCEILVYLSAICYFMLHLEFFGNRNSLGVAMGVLAFPWLLWGVLIAEGGFRRGRRIFALLLCQALLLASYERAGIVAALVSSAVLCIGLRRYRLLFTASAIALVTALAVMTFVPLPAADHSDDGSLTSRFVYKGKRDIGVLGTRRSIWQKTWISLQAHPWFGTGFGTSATSYDKSGVAKSFSSGTAITREHGNSYLEIAEWVGVLGVAPFLALLLLIVANVGRVFVWMRRTGSARSPAVPLAIFAAGALVHAGFEDWMFAVGYHTSVVFWAFAFLLAELTPAIRTQPRAAAIPVQIVNKNFSFARTASCTYS